MVSLLLLLYPCASMTALAEIKPNNFNITPLIGGYAFESNQNLEDGSLFGLGFGYNFDEHWGTEVQFNYIDTEVDDTGESVDGYLYRLDGLYHFMPDSKLVPYLAAGIGGITLDPDKSGSDTDAFINGGGGLKYFVTESIALRGDIRYVLSSGSTHNNLAYFLGVIFHFGGKKKVTAPTAQPSVDSDGDGVYDDQDQCPDTPSGATVDSLGCPLDSDGDGVYDYLDKCPSTPTGARVDENGCPIILKETVSIELKIEFDLNRADIRPQFHKQLKKVADFMKEYPETTVRIEGHTDNAGPDQYNLQLSQKRAESVRQYLINNFSIAPKRLSAKGFGESRPIASNATREGRRKNRRVVAVVSAIKETQRMRE